MTAASGLSRRAFRVAYDGRPYYGFQRQPDVPTVEGELFDAFRELGVFEAPEDHDPEEYTPEHRPPGYAAAGRTDAGVSALAQTVALDAPEWLTPRALNGVLPGSVRAWASADAPAGFHATHDATRRVYTYHLHAPHEGAPGDGPARVPPVDDDRARAALDALAGEHDLHNFTPDDSGTVRTLDCSARRDGDFLLLEVAADGFPKGLVRRLVSLVHAVGTGDADLARVERALGPEKLTGPDGVATAPAEPLVLTGVDYPRLVFERDAEAAESAAVVFAGAQTEALTRSRVADTLAEGVREGSPHGSAQ